MTGAGLALSFTSRESHSSFTALPTSEELAEYAIIPHEFEKPVPAELKGGIVNCAYLTFHANSPAMLDQIAREAREFGASAIRVFIGDSFGPVELEKIRRLAEKYPLHIDLFDTFRMLHAAKPSLVLTPQKLDSSYLMGAETDEDIRERQLAFFTDPEIRMNFINRVKTIVQNLRDAAGIKVWSVANEPEPPIEDWEEKRKILTDWYVEVIKAIREEDHKRPIVSGVADPTLLDEERLKEVGLTANTIHLYPGFGSSSVDAVSHRYMNEHMRVLPLFCQEIGYYHRVNLQLPARAFSIPLPLHDQRLSSFLHGTALRFAQVDTRNQTLKLPFTGIGLWQLDYDNPYHKDGFEVKPKDVPLTTQTLKTWGEFLLK